jgi:hypothetical protein
MVHTQDRMGNFMAGVTGQIKLSDRVVNGILQLSLKQDLTFDGAVV